MPVLTRRSSVSVGGEWAGKPLAWRSVIDDYVQHDVVEIGGHLWEATDDVPPGCPPLGVGDGSVVDRDLLLARRFGYGAATTGGYDYATIHVTNGNNSGAGSLRQAILDAAAAGGGWIVFDSDITVEVDTQLLMESFNVTIDGRGHDTVINSSGAAVNNRVIRIGDFSGVFDDGGPDTITALAGNIILTGFTTHTGFDSGGNSDVIAVLWKTKDLWLDHLDLTNNSATQGDELINVGYGSNRITVGWTRFHDHYKAVLFGSGQDGKFWDGHPDHGQRVTVGWSLSTDNADRSMRVGGGDTGNAKFHLLNSMIRNWGTGAGGASVDAAQYLAEGCIFQPSPGATGQQLIGIKATTEPVVNDGYLRAVNCDLRDGATLETNLDGSVTDPSYSYAVDAADATLETRLDVNAGVPTLWALVS